MNKRRNKPVKRSSNQNNAQGNKTVSSARLTHFSGPLPPPEVLKGYDLVVPGAALRIIQHAEREILHRHEMDQMQCKSQIKISESLADASIRATSEHLETRSNVMVFGVRSGVSVIVSCIFFAIIFGFMGNDFMAGSLLACSFGATIFGGVGSMLRGSAKDKKDVED